ncbi:hypothetical protein [Lachnospira multipara]|uniref:hypothetical protein n=1 Tax=Lachnospira multipara TaxID=28051 RepID=UPI0004896700|nr:hypothetical protein [Lachnospira multipara]
MLGKGDVYAVGVIEEIYGSQRKVNYKVGVEVDGKYRRAESYGYRGDLELLSEGEIVDVIYNKNANIVRILDGGLIKSGSIYMVDKVTYILWGLLILLVAITCLL